MVVKYNSLNRLERPKLTLCNPGSVYDNGALTKVVGILADHEAEEVVLNFNATSELNFRVNRVPREDPEENAHIYSLYRQIQNRRLIFVDDIGYFMITGIQDGFDGGVHYKDVTAQSIDVEIQQKMIPFIEDGTYPFQTDISEEHKGILETIVETLPLWTIGYVDEAVAEKWRTFEDVDTSLNCLAFFLENIQDAYECIVLFDTIHRTVNVYDQNDYVRETNIHITKDDVINSIDITENADDLYTAVSVLGDENVTIGAINPTGTNTIYNFDYYLDWMPSALSAKVVSWKNAVNAAQGAYYTANLDYYETLEEVSEMQAEVNRLNTQIAMYQRCRDNIVAEQGKTDLVDDYNAVIVNNGGTAITIWDDMQDTLDGIKALISTCEFDLYDMNAALDAANIALGTYRATIQEIQESLDIATYFTAEEYEELCHYIFEGSYTDEYVVITDIMSYEEKFAQMKTLYDRAKARLAKVSAPTQEFNIDVENFIFVKDFEHWSEQLETGCLINVELDTNDIAQLFLSNITVNYDDHTMSMTFGNRFNKFDPKSLFEDVLGDISKSANTLNYIKDILYPIKSGQFNAVKEALQSSRDLTMGSALASRGEEVVIDGSGYTGKKLLGDGTYDPRQVKITGQNIVFTDDAWEHCKVAIGELLFGGDGESAYGVNAETLIGNVIMGNNLQILDDNGTPLLDVVDGKISTKVDAVDGRVTTLEQDANSISIRVQALEDDNGEVDHVTTTMGYTFDNEGLNIHRAGEEIRNKLTHTGMYVTRSGEEVLTANNEGVNAINLTARQYLIVGANSRFEDYSNGVGTKRTACFYIGG